MAKRGSGKRRPKRGRSSGAGRRLFLWGNLAVALAIGGWYVVQPPARQAEVRLLVGNAFEKDKRVSPWDVAWDLYQLYYSADYIAVGPPAGDRTYAYAGLPRGGGARVLVNRAYVVGYGEAVANPLWSVYRIADVSPLPSAPERPERFEVDGRTVGRVAPDDYTNSGYDRGHLAPNYAIGTRYGAEAQRETFLMSNVIPQRHALNAGVWKEIEQDIATSYPARFGEVWVIAGPIFGERPRRLSRRGPAIPEACYMIVVDESDGRLRTMAFIFSEDTPSGTEANHYLVSIDEVERRTGLDFFAELEDVAEAQVEAQVASRVW